MSMKMGRLSGHKSKVPSRPLMTTHGIVGTETFTFLSPYSNLDLYPSMDQPPYLDLHHYPTMLDVIRTRHYLSLKLPTELIDLIVDLAEYWPHTSSVLDMSTRVYRDNMRYGSYGRGPRSLWNSRTNSSDARREWQEKGFVLRTPPLGLRCVQSDDPRKGYVRSLLPPHPKTPKTPKNPKEDALSWLPPRGKRPARAIIFEILSREERPTDRGNGSGFRDDPKTSFEASVDTIKRSKSGAHLLHQPLHWTTDAATKKSYQQATLNPKEKEMPYTFQPRQSSSANPGLTQTFPVTWNRTAQNRKTLVVYKYDDRMQYSQEKERFLSADIVRGFVRSLREGDCITLWARALEGAGPCCNVVDRVKIHVFWAV